MNVTNSGASWNQREIRRPDRPLVEWLHLGTLGEVALGVLRDGSWVVDTADGLADLEDTRALVFVFPVLTSPILEILDQLAEFKRSAGSVNCKEFPLKQLVLRAISHGGYWAEQSFPWLWEIELDDKENAAVIAGLMSIESNKRFSQKLRHTAKHYRRRLVRPTGE